MEGDSSNNITSNSSSTNMLPPGFRFHPTDEELLTCYLISKISNPYSPGREVLIDVDLNKCEPWDLPGNAKIGEKEWYFFSHRDRKYPTGVRTNRATKSGYWKTTGRDKEIFSSSTSELIGRKKTLVFYKGRAPRGAKTDWVMHEFRLYFKPTFPSTQEEWVICRVFRKTGGVKKYQSNYKLEIGPLVGSLQSPVSGSSSYCGLNASTGGKNVIPALNLPKAVSSNTAASINAGSPFATETGYVGEPDIANNVQNNGYLGFQHSVNLHTDHTYWTSFLLN